MITVQPLFWVFAGLIGFLNSGTLPGTAVWIVIIFVSVLFHEFGHALTAMIFKQKVRIALIAMGGVTTFTGPKLAYWKQFLITLAGPLFSFLLFVIASILMHTELASTPLRWAQFANLFWTIVNLFPALPLDGGQLMRITLEGIFGLKGFKASLLLSALFAALVAGYFLMIQAFLIGAFFFLFAFQSFDIYRKSRHATMSDLNETTALNLAAGEKALQLGHIDEAKRHFREVLNGAPNSLLAKTAAQFLAFLAVKEHQTKEAYELLLPIRKELADDSLCLLHDLADAMKNYNLVIELSAECYQIAPSEKAALANARAYAYSNFPEQAGGWLQSALQYGRLNLDLILAEEPFSTLKTNPKFREFLP